MSIISFFFGFNVQISAVIALLNPSNIRVDICSKQAFENPSILGSLATYFEGANSTDCFEPWFGFRYKRAKIPEGVVHRWEQSRLQTVPELHFPAPNPFIPTDFSLIGLQVHFPYLTVLNTTHADKIILKQFL
jgi:secreted Zn-dependent insulinase-like peptidase